MSSPSPSPFPATPSPSPTIPSAFVCILAGDDVAEDFYYLIRMKSFEVNSGSEEEKTFERLALLIDSKFRASSREKKPFVAIAKTLV